MAYIMTAEDIARLEAAKGQFVSTSGLCTAEGHERIAHHSPYASHEGILIGFDVHPETKELRFLFLKKGEKITPVCLNVKNTDFVWNIMQMIFIGEEKREKVFTIFAD